MSAWLCARLRCAAAHSGAPGSAGAGGHSLREGDGSGERGREGGEGGARGGSVRRAARVLHGARDWHAQHVPRGWGWQWAPAQGCSEQPPSTSACARAVALASGGVRGRPMCGADPAWGRCARGSIREGACPCVHARREAQLCLALWSPRRSQAAAAS